jgi:nucleoside-diphosphate kinase
MERTFIMIKPDAVRRRLIGKILSRIEERGIKIVAMKYMQIPRELAEKHYAEHTEKPFFNELVEFITSGPVVPMVLEADNAVEMVRKMMGETHPQNSLPGTIRGDFATDLSQNVVHGSDSNETAAREISLFFTEDELVE